MKAAAAAFQRAPADGFVLEDTSVRRLEHHPWPAARYAMLILRSARVGIWSLGYELDRFRPGAYRAEHVARETTVEVLPVGSRRTLLLSHPYRFPIVLGDSIEIPVPLDDPWGTIGPVTWTVAPVDRASAPTFAPGPCQDAAKLPQPPSVPAALQQLGVGCTDVLRANLETRTNVWLRYGARAPGPVPELFVEVVSGTGPVVSPLKDWVERVTNGSSSTTFQLDRQAVVPLRIGDEIWALRGKARPTGR